MFQLKGELMNPNQGTAGLDLILYILQNVDIFLVILVRMLGFFLMLPVISGRSVPAAAKISIAGSLAVIAFVSGMVTEIYYYDNFIGYVVLLAVEFFTGLLIAYGVSTAFQLFYFTGQLVDYQIGFSMVSVFDPVSQIQVPVTGNFYYLIICAFFVMTNGLRQMIHTLYFSYEVLPPGAANLIGNPDLFSMILTIMTSFIVLAVRIALPIMATILVVDVALGLLVKAVPQMNIFVVGMPMKLMIGLIVLYITAPTLSYVYEFVYNEAMAFVFNIIKGMMPS